MRQFLEAGDADAKAGLTRFPARDLPLIRAFYADRPFAEHAWEIRDAGLLSNEERSYFSYAVALEDGVRIVAVTGRDDGTLAVDWKCFASHEETPWESVLASGERSSEADFRVIASRSDYRNFEFGEPGGWAAYRLLRPGREMPVYGYARIGSTAQAAMESALDAADRRRIMVRIRATGRSPESGQVEILSCLQNDWLERAPETSG